MQIIKSNPEGIPVLTIQGQLDGTTSPQLESELLNLIQDRSPQVILDLAQVPLVSSAALRVLLSAAKRMKKHGGHIGLCALRPEVKQVFDISDLTTFFAIQPDLSEALSTTRAAPAEPSAVEPAKIAPPLPPPLPVVDAEPSLATAPEPPQASAPTLSPPVPIPAAPLEADPSATMTFSSTSESDADPLATMVFSSRRVPAKIRPENAESQQSTHPEAAAPVEPSPTAAMQPPAAERLTTPPSLAQEPATPTVPPVALSFSIAPSMPSPPVSGSKPPAVPPNVEPAPSSTPVPAAPLRRTSPAILAKAAELRGDPPPTLVPATRAPVPPPPPPAVPLEVAATAAPLQTRKHEPPTIAPPDAPKPPARPLLPIIAAAIVALLVLVGLVGYLLFGKKEKPRKPDRSASSSPTATARPAHTPVPTPVAELTPTPAPTVVATNPSPTASSLPTPKTLADLATPAATPAVAQITPPPIPTPSQTPVPTPPAETIMSATGTIDTNRSSPENQAIRQAVLQRIDAMPLSQGDKARLYAALENAHGLGKLVTINFATGHTDLAPKDVVSLDNTLHRPKVQHFLDDPSVVLVVLGFSDTKGNEKTNKDVSDRRARRVVEALRGPCNVNNMIHSIGMGGQTIAGESLDKNRVVEIWAVLP